MGVKKERATCRENFIKKLHCGGLLEGKGASRESTLFLYFLIFVFKETGTPRPCMYADGKGPVERRKL